MIYKFRAILDAEEDIFRDIAIESDNSLEDLHNALINAFGFDGTEVGTFYHIPVVLIGLGMKKMVFRCLTQVIFLAKSKLWLNID